MLYKYSLYFGLQMRIPALSKIGSVGLIVLAGLLMLGTSVAEDSLRTSEKTQPAAISSVREAAPLIQRVRSTLKRKRPSGPTLIASLPKPKPQSTLLAVVTQKDIKDNHQKLADKVLRALPPQCRTYLKSFYVQYSGATRRGLGGKTTIILDGSVPDAEFAALLTHECGHVTHGNMLGTSGSSSSAFKDGNDIFYNDSPVAQFFAISWTTETVLKKEATKNDFVSGYAKSDAFEDFAESFAMYVLHRNAFKERAKTNTAIAAKLKWMETNMPLPENAIGVDGYTWNKEVPWDVTKLAMTLNAGF
jgi:hypothetical protein